MNLRGFFVRALAKAMALAAASESAGASSCIDTLAMGMASPPKPFQTGGTTPARPRGKWPTVGGTSFSPPPPPYAPAVTSNSLVGQQLAGPDWNGIGLVPSDSTTAVRASVTLVTGLYVLNIANNAPAGDRAGHPFAIAPGTSSLDCTVGVGSYLADVGQTLTFRLIKPDGSVVKTMSCAATPGGTHYLLHSVPGDGWAPLDELYLQMLVNEDGRQHRVVITELPKVLPNGASGVFADPLGFDRISNNALTYGSALPGYDLATNFGRCEVHQAFATFTIDLNATAVVLEHTSTLVAIDTAGTPNPFGYSTQNAALGVRVGAPSQSVSHVVITNGGTMYLGATIGVTFSAPGGGGVTATGYAKNVAGSLVEVVITDPGSGYTSAPTVTFDPTGGVLALGHVDVMFGAPVPYNSRVDAANTIALQLATVNGASTGGALDGTTKRLEIVSGHWALKTSLANNGLTPYTTSLRCMYVGRSSTYTVLPGDLTLPGLAIVSESIWSGAAFFPTDQPTHTAAAMCIRYGDGSPRFPGPVYVLACGSSKIEDWLGQAGDTTKADLVAGRLAVANIVKTYNSFETNSGRDGIDPDVHYRCRRQFADSLRTAIPTGWQLDVAMIPRAGFEEGTGDQLREQTWLNAYAAGLTSPGGGAAANHSTWMNWVLGSSWISLSQLSDGVHVKEVEQPNLAIGAMALIQPGYVTPPAQHPYQRPGWFHVWIADDLALFTNVAGNVTQISDGAGSALKLVPTGATGPAYGAATWTPDGTAALTTIAARGLKSNANVLMGYFDCTLVGRATTGTTAVEFFVDNSDAETYGYGDLGNSLQVRRATGGGLTAAKNIAANWLVSAGVHAWEFSQQGRMTNLRMFKDGVGLATADVTVNDVLGTQVNAPFYLFANQANAFGVSGIWKFGGVANHQGSVAWRVWFTAYSALHWGTPP